ncbi:hypothetical protein AXG93_868s1110 [Marchantia polymorpha subsp. ruderalis]|uniref:Uncharacterized protein n=1 Tax=Marchantia polymorpha subsp. ruderalis TaxID=1480154 RepID=A0A176VK24_MARPO|nr:hypothetical protein AXG93_868s1110 [Marchantia polymorpha subsp. ruderalis]
MAAEVSNSSVEKTVAPIVSTFEVVVGKLTQPVEMKGPSGVLIEVTADAPAEPLKEGIEIVGGTVVEATDIALPSSPVEEVRSEEEMKTSEEEPKELVVCFPDFLQDSVVPLLKYLDGKKEKYVVSKEAGLYVQMEFGRCVELEGTCGGLRKSNENGQKMTADLLTRLKKSREAYDEAVKRSERLITTAERREKKYIKELATLEAQRAEEVRIAKELRGKIAETKTAEEDLRRKISEIELGKADMRSQELQSRMEKVEEAYRQLRDKSTDELKLCLEKRLNGFAMWGLQTVKWLKLDSLERRLMSAKTSGSAGRKHIVELVNTFLEVLNEARQNVEVQIVNVLRRLGVDTLSTVRSCLSKLSHQELCVFGLNVLSSRVLLGI